MQNIKKIDKYKEKIKILLYIHYQIRNKIILYVLFWWSWYFKFTVTFIFNFSSVYSYLIYKIFFHNQKHYYIFLKIRTTKVYEILLEDNLIYRLSWPFFPPKGLTLTSVWRPHHSSQFPLPFLWTLLSSSVVK